VKLALLFVSMCFLGGIGAALGSMVGHGFGRGGLLAGGFVGGVLFCVAGGFIGERLHWIRPPQRPWVILGGVFGFALACMVALSTLSTPIGPALGTLLIGSGAVLGAVVGKSPHEEA
jgi:hypothetical protein